MGVILTVYFILEGRHAYDWFLTFIPLASRDRLDMTLQRARLRMDKWLVGQGSLMLILGICSTLIFVILKVRYAYALGVLMGALNLIPVLGGAIGISLALLSASIDSWGSVIGVAVFYAIYLWIENSFLIPRIMQNRLNLPGLAVLVSLLIGSAMAGILGAMVAIPTAVLVAVLLEEYAVTKGCCREQHGIGSSPMTTLRSHTPTSTGAIMLTALKLNLEGFELRNHALLRSDPPDGEGLGLVALPTEVGEAQER